MKNKEKLSYSEAVKFLKTKKYRLANIGISHKTSFDWRAHGVYLQEKTTKARMKYSPIEYIWLLMVKELREFGLPLKSITHLKSLVLEPLNMKEIMSVFGHFNNPLINPKDVKQSRGSDELIDSKLELVNLIEKLQDNIVESMFTSMLISILLQKEDYILYIKKDGECLIETIEQDNLKLITPQNNFKKETCLRIRLKTFVKEFLEKEEVKEYDLPEKVDKKSMPIIEKLEFKSKKGFGEIPEQVYHHIEQIMSKSNFKSMVYYTEDGNEMSINRIEDKKNQ